MKCVVRGTENALSPSINHAKTILRDDPGVEIFFAPIEGVSGSSGSCRGRRVPRGARKSLAAVGQFWAAVTIPRGCAGVQFIAHLPRSSHAALNYPSAARQSRVFSDVDERAA